MDKQDMVLVMAGGIFNKGDNFFRPIIPWFEKRGYVHFHIVNYPLRNVPFNCRNPEQLIELGRKTLKQDLLFLENEIYKLSTGHQKNKALILIAHSKSGVLGQVLAQYSSIDGLVAICPVPPRGISALSLSGFWHLKSILAQIMKTGSTRIPVSRTYSDTVKGAFHPKMTMQQQQEAYGQLVWESGRIIWELAFDRYLNSDTSSPLYVDEKKVKIPMFFIGGDLDKIVRAGTVRKIALKYNKAQALIFRNVAHYPFWGEPGQAVLVEIDRWINKYFLPS